MTTSGQAHRSDKIGVLSVLGHQPHTELLIIHSSEMPVALAVVEWMNWYIGANTEILIVLQLMLLQNVANINLQHLLM